MNFLKWSSHQNVPQQSWRPPQNPKPFGSPLFEHWLQNPLPQEVSPHVASFLSCRGLTVLHLEQEMSFFAIYGGQILKWSHNSSKSKISWCLYECIRHFTAHCCPCRDGRELNEKCKLDSVFANFYLTGLWETRKMTHLWFIPVNLNTHTHTCSHARTHTLQHPALQMQF